MAKRLIIIDISSFIFRAFYAIRPLHADDGTPVNAVHGTLSMLLKLLSDYRPTHVFVAKDSKGPGTREEIYPLYKANRQEPPEELIPQFSLINELLEKMHLPGLLVEKYEADDVIGSAVVQWKTDFDEILIASGDKDLMQFVSGHVKMVDTMKDKIYGRDDVFLKMGVWPEQIEDYLSILGDTSDNIPGMKGIGAKGAARLLGEYGTLDKCVEAKEKLKGKRLQQAFENHLDDAYLSKKLVKIKTDLPLNTTVNDIAYRFEGGTALLDFLEKLNLKQQIKKINDITYGDREAARTQNHDSPNTEGFPSFIHRIVNDEKTFKNLETRLAKGEEASVFFSWDNDQKPVSASVSFDGKTSFYLPFAHKEESLGDKSNLDNKYLERLLNASWENPQGKLICLFAKRYLLYGLTRKRQFPASFFDITQAHFVAAPHEKHDLSFLVESYLKDIPSFEQKGHLSQYGLNTAADIAGIQANVMVALASILRNELKQLNLTDIYEKMDAPLIRVLAKMEFFGVQLDGDFFHSLKKEFESELEKIEQKIHQLIDDPEKKINLRSPKQVGEILFDHLSLPILKKTKTGPSTSSDVLEELNSFGTSEVPAMILKYRELDKLLSTYVNTLPNLIHKKSGRLHANFNQHIASTGRLSSDNPNLQNIPVRNKNGRRIRQGFVAKSGFVFLSADYSQVELRILAHFSQDSAMKEAFENDRDIHTQTAAEVHGISPDDVQAEERSRAKAVNFGLIYGQSSFGLARTLGITRQEAHRYITKYFEQFSQIKGYLDSLKEFCETHGYSKTLHGRKRPLPDIHTKNRTVKASAERMAINGPIQGTAADIIKLAMLAIDEAIEKKSLNARMILQVHDELIFEVIEEHADKLKELVRTKMEEAVSLSIPLKVQTGMGRNWFDLK